MKQEKKFQPQFDGEGRFARTDRTAEARRRFMAWLLTPPDARSPATQTELAHRLRLHPPQLSRWKMEPDFIAELAKAVRSLTLERLQPVVAALVKRAEEGDLAAIKLYFQFVLGWTERAEIAHEHTGFIYQFGEDPFLVEKYNFEQPTPGGLN
jgi:hypothetical protein